MRDKTDAPTNDPKTCNWAAPLAADGPGAPKPSGANAAPVLSDGVCAGDRMLDAASETDSAAQAQLMAVATKRTAKLIFFMSIMYIYSWP